jgi:succinate-semialdehyde dehydrogenase / glutarate-semialdehyde dehydrogenase
MTKVSKIADRLEQHESLYASLISDEMGKPQNQAHHEIRKCVDLIRFYSQNFPLMIEPRKPLFPASGYNCTIKFEPLGVILGIMPWNYPFWQVFRFVVPAMLAGNCVVIKHASNVLGCGHAINEVFKETGAFDFLPLSSSSVESLIPHIDGVSFTGSTEVGKKIGAAAGANLKKCVLELGGSDACIISEYSQKESLSQIAEKVVKDRLWNTGQSCVSPKRIFVCSNIYEEVLSHSIDAFKKTQFGLDFGPVFSKQAKAQIESEIQNVIKDGGTMIVR